MKGLFLDASDALAAVFHAVSRARDPAVTLNLQAHVDPAELPALLAGYDFVLNDHSFMPTDAMRGCTDLRHVIFLGTGARSYMDPEALAGARHHRSTPSRATATLRWPSTPSR